MVDANVKIIEELKFRSQPGLLKRTRRVERIPDCAWAMIENSTPKRHAESPLGDSAMTSPVPAGSLAKDPAYRKNE